jgi:FkbM family methyltransferase
MSIIGLLKFITTHPLNRGSKLQSIARLAKWQIGSRLAPGAIVYDWINGSRFLVRTGETGLTGNIYTGLHEFPDMGYLLHVLRDGDLFVDVGANVGSYTILACAAVGARGYAFEPVPSIYRRFIENVRLNNLEGRVICLNVGVGSEEGTASFTSDMDTTNHVIASGEQTDNVINVRICTLDDALRNESPALVKIDVEGYETPALQGAQETLKKPSLHSVIMELNGSGSRYGFNESRILEMMFDHGFKTYSYNPLARSLIKLNGKNLASGNTLFIRDYCLVLQNLASSPKIRIFDKEF